MYSPNKVGVVFGVLLGGAHVMWSLVVLSGVGQALYDFIFWAHMIHLPAVIGPFDMTASVTLIVVTAVLGYVMGYLGAAVWRYLHKAA